MVNYRDKLNVIIPLYNPHTGWEDKLIDSISELQKELKESDLTVILVNDGSTIQVNTQRIMERSGNIRYYYYPVNRGKGYAIRYGINVSEADFYVYTDVDFPFGYNVISETFRILKSSGTNIVIGTRDASYFRILPLKRRIYSFLLKELNFLITGFKIKDTQAGLKGLDNNGKKVLAETETDTFLFELEFLKRSIKQGLTYRFIDVKCSQGLKFTDFRLSILLKETISLMKLLFN